MFSINRKEAKESSQSPFINEAQFRENLHHFDIKEEEYPREKLIALYLLMKGKFVTHLTTMLEEPEVPNKVKLLICQFFIDGKYFETSEIVSKTLKETVKEAHSK